MQEEYVVIGLMSGTSLDGLDIVACKFSYKENEIIHLQKIIAAETIQYDDYWTEKLMTCRNLSAFDFMKLHADYGRYLGTQVIDFLKKHQIKADIVSSHGHTVFHQPQLGFTTQIGDGANMAVSCQLPVVCDFRSMDVACGGQGAPLVPIGDEILYADYDYCLNIGGIANISYRFNNQRVAFDISPANMALNYFAKKMGKKYDENGEIAQNGTLNQQLFDELNKLNYYYQNPPKSLGIEWFESNFLPIIQSFNIENKDILTTLTHHIAFQISRQVEIESFKKMLITGGGAKNTYLCKLIAKYCGNLSIIIPEEVHVDYKEAIIFALLGLLRWKQKNNCLSSVTGAKQNVVGGAVYYFK